MRVSDLMSTEVISVKIPSDRRVALRLMVKHSISGLPVVDEGGSLVGIITRKDIFRKSTEEQLAL
ncbi:MAG: CBS domain-containing protein, partial [Thermoplasmata archaeon]|nr:CBS domain-containing protein [Thermoplasmata archaeon]